MSTADLRERLANGELSAAQARKAIAALPARLDAAEAAALYAGLRAWTWKALDQRRRDDDLRDWANLIRRACLRVAGHGRERQLETLAELIAESVAVATRLPISELLAKRHVREVLTLLYTLPDREASKKTVMETLGVGQANLWRVMNPTSAAGLVEIERRGRETWYALSRLGVKEATKFVPLREEASKAGYLFGVHLYPEAPAYRPHAIEMHEAVCDHVAICTDTSWIFEHKSHFTKLPVLEEIDIAKLLETGVRRSRKQHDNHSLDWLTRETAHG
ncbi:hypothetical protein [Sphingomonas koreensis]